MKTPVDSFQSTSCQHGTKGLNWELEEGLIIRNRALEQLANKQSRTRIIKLRFSDGDTKVVLVTAVDRLNNSSGERGLVGESVQMELSTKLSLSASYSSRQAYISTLSERIIREKKNEPTIRFRSIPREIHYLLCRNTYPSIETIRTMHIREGIQMLDPL